MGLADRTYMHPWNCPCSECEGNRQKDEGKKRDAELALEDKIWQEKEFADNFDKMMRPPAPVIVATPAPALAIMGRPALEELLHPKTSQPPAPKREKKQKPTPVPISAPALGIVRTYTKRPTTPKTSQPPAPKRKKKQKPTPAPVPIPTPAPTPPDALVPQPEVVRGVPWKQLLMGALVVGLSVILLLAYAGVI